MRPESVPLLAVGAVAGGIGAGHAAGPGRAPVALATAVLALGAAWFVARPPQRAALVLVGCAVLGVAVTQRALDGLVHHDLVPALDARADVTLTGALVSDPAAHRWRTTALLRVRGVDRIVLVRADGDDAGRLAALRGADRVTVRGRLGPLTADGPGRRARIRHAIGVLDDAHVGSFSPPTGPAAVLTEAIRSTVVRGARPLPPTTRALLNAFLLGDTRAIPTDVAGAYRDAGLSHLLAVSGANVAFVLAICGPLLRRLALAPRTFVAIAVVVAFAAVTRFEPSVLRASGLATVSVLATFAGRPASRVRALAYAVIVLLVIDPFLLESVGFQLSCAASLGIAVLSAPIARRVPGPRFVREPLAVSVAAQVGVLPLLFVTFGDAPLVTPVANLAAGPAAEAIGVYGLLAGIVGGLVPLLAPVLQPVDAVLVGWVTTVARVASRVPDAAVVVLGTVVLVATLGRRARSTRRHLVGPAR